MARGMVSGRLRRRLLVATLVGCAVAAGSATAADARGVVPTDKGPVRGIETAATKQYLGIPFAAPPVGDLRWRPPQPAARWRGPRDASRFGSNCPQTASPFGRASTTEDCLYLNVFAPSTKGRGHAKNLPVMVWLHGGALTVGEADDYDPSRLVQKGVIVVTTNYRLGYLGFLSHPALSAESESQVSGNYGLMDQQAALRWVERNIRKFGGDAGNVTIFGESAGGLSVHSHLVSPLSAGLFDRAIVQSGAYSLEQPSLAEAESRGRDVANVVGCGDHTAACLRSVSVDALLASQPTTAGAIGPNLDANVLPRSIGAAFESGQFSRVPVIEGSNHDEFTIFTALYVEFVVGQIPSSFYPVIVSILLPTLGLDVSPQAVVSRYPVTSSVGLALSAIGTDAVFACPGRRAAQSLSRFVPTYAYEFNDPDTPQIFVRPASFPYGAYHAGELQYLFDSPARGHSTLDADQETLADTMVRYWTQFARSGAPNAAGTPQWPAYTEANDSYQSLKPPTPQPDTGFAADHQCGFWDAQ